MIKKKNFFQNKQKAKNELKKFKDKKTFKTKLERKTQNIKKLGKLILKKTKYFKRKKFRKIFKFLSRKIKYNINIKITPNNIFCILKDNNKNKTILLISAGILHLKISKKKLKFVNKILIQNFIDKINKKLKQKTCIVKISGPKKITKFISKKLILSLIKTKLLINILNKKIFNGCRAKKARKKKRKGLRVFK